MIQIIVRIILSYYFNTLGAASGFATLRVLQSRPVFAK